MQFYLYIYRCRNIHRLLHTANHWHSTLTVSFYSLHYISVNLSAAKQSVCFSAYFFKYVCEWAKGTPFKMMMDRESLSEWAKDKPLSILQLDPADRAVLRIAGKWAIMLFVFTSLNFDRFVVRFACIVRLKTKTNAAVLAANQKLILLNGPIEFHLHSFIVMKKRRKTLRAPFRRFACEHKQQSTLISWNRIFRVKLRLFHHWISCCKRVCFLFYPLR